jgi:hypothetical protein
MRKPFIYATQAGLNAVEKRKPFAHGWESNSDFMSTSL